MKKNRTREEILAKRNEPVVTTVVKYTSPVAMGHPLSVEVYNPFLSKVLKNAGDDFKFPGNRDRSKE